MIVTAQIKQLISTDQAFSAQLKTLLAWDQTEDQSIHQKVLQIIWRHFNSIITMINHVGHSTGI